MARDPDPCPSLSSPLLPPLALWEHSVRGGGHFIRSQNIMPPLDRLRTIGLDAVRPVSLHCYLDRLDSYVFNYICLSVCLLTGLFKNY